MTITMKDFEQHLQDNPHIYPMFEKFTLEAAQYRKHFSAQAVIERIRWDTAIRENGSDFKISHNWRAFYAKKFEDDYPKYKGFFRLRKDFSKLDYFDVDL